MVELDSKFSDTVFIDFWQRYCNIYNSMFEKKDPLGAIKTTFHGGLGLSVGEEIDVPQNVLQNGQGTQERVAHRLGTTRDGIRKILDKLRQDGRLVREGSTKSGKWIVNNND